MFPLKVTLKNFVKIFLIIPVLIFFCFISCSRTDSKKSAITLLQSDSPSAKNNIEEKNIKENNISDSLICIIGVGDLMLGSNYPTANSLPPDDGRYLMDSVKDIPENADIVFGNLEGTFLNEGGVPKRCNTPEHCYSFRTPESYCEILKDAGFNLVSLANNHSNDMGDEGRESTIRTLEKNSILFAGYSELPFTIFNKNGIKFGFTAFAPNYSAQDMNNLTNAAKVVRDLKEKCDIVIVSFHGGAEGSNAVRVPKRREIFLDEDRGDVYEFAHEVINAGADIVFGSGPHVPRALELYKDKIIAYSLGNFCTYGKFSIHGRQGIAPLLKIYTDKNGNFVKGNVHSYRQTDGGYPVPDPELSAALLIKELTEKDFPETQLIINGKGEIEKKTK